MVVGQDWSSSKHLEKWDEHERLEAFRLLPALSSCSLKRKPQISEIVKGF